MKTLWAPWRMSYILDEQKQSGCVFCTAMDLSEEESLVVFSSRFCLIMMNKYPYNNGHLLIVPLRHIANLSQLKEEESSDIFSNLNNVVEVLKKVLNPDGFNIGVNLGYVAGAGIEDHLHFHVVPRWNGDTNFMTVLSSIRSIPEHIKVTRDRLREFFIKM